MIKIIFPQCLINMGLQFFVGFFIINKYGKMIFICCVHFLQISMCCQRGVPIWFTWGPHMVYMGSPYVFYMYMIKCGWIGYLRWLMCYSKAFEFWSISCITERIERIINSQTKMCKK